MTKVQRRKKGRKARGGALFLISVLLFGSATLRLGVEAGPVISNEVSQRSQDAVPHEEHAEQDVPAPEELQALLVAFQQRQQELDVREDRIQDRMKALEIAESAIETKLAALVDAEEKLRETLALADGASEGDLTRLTSVYEKMKPKDAAALFEEMDPAFAAGFLGRMRPETAAGVLARLSPTAAYTISVMLAGRNATVPRD